MDQALEHIPNHTVDQLTGMVESNGFLTAFDVARKTKFLEMLRHEGLGLYRTCRKLGMSVSTVHRHYKIDPVFRDAYDRAKVEYTDELEAVSRVNALNPRSVIERIFQLKAFLPEKYGDRRTSGESLNISISLDGATLQNLSKRDQIVETRAIPGTPGDSTESVEYQQSDLLGTSSTGSLSTTDSDEPAQSVDDQAL